MAVPAACGWVLDSRLSRLTKIALRAEFWVGPRWRSPAGPIAVDLAYGQSDHRVRLQFAVAIAF